MKEIWKDTAAKQLYADLYGCNPDALDDISFIKSLLHTLCDCLKTEIVEECYHKFEPIGISAIAVISASHLSIHTWPEYGYAAIDIFSCQKNIPEEVCRIFAESLQSEHMETHLVTRNLVYHAPSNHTLM